MDVVTDKSEVPTSAAASRPVNPLSRSADNIPARVVPNSPQRLRRKRSVSNNTARVNSQKRNTNLRISTDSEIGIDVDLPNTIPIDEPEIEELNTKWICPRWACPARCYPVACSNVFRAIAALCLLSLLIIALILSVIPNSPVLEALQAFLLWVGSIPLVYQIVAILILFLISSPLGTPITPINIACGFLFKLTLGLGVALFGSMLGSLVCFVCGKTLLHSYVIRKTQKMRMLKALSIAVKSKKAIPIIALTHLSPIVPSSLLHYTYAAVGVDIIKFSIGTFLGVLPFVVVYVVVGSFSRDFSSAISDSSDGSWKKQLLWIPVIVIVSGAILVIVTWVGKREINKVMADMDKAEAEAAGNQTGALSEMEMDELPVSIHVIQPGEAIVESPSSSSVTIPSKEAVIESVTKAKKLLDDDDFTIANGDHPLKRKEWAEGENDEQMRHVDSSSSIESDYRSAIHLHSDHAHFDDLSDHDDEYHNVKEEDEVLALSGRGLDAAYDVKFTHHDDDNNNDEEEKVREKKEDNHHVAHHYVEEISEVDESQSALTEADEASDAEDSEIQGFVSMTGHTDDQDLV